MRLRNSFFFFFFYGKTFCLRSNKHLAENRIVLELASAGGREGGNKTRNLSQRHVDSVHFIYLTDENMNRSEPADGRSVRRPVGPASGGKMLQEWPGCLRGEFSGADKSWDSSQQFDCVMENRLMYSFVVLSARSALLLLFFVPSAQCLASLIPPEPCTRILFGPLLFSFPAFSPEKLCLVLFPPLSFFFFFSLWLRFSPVSVLNCGWHVRALAKPSLRRQVFMAGYVHNGAFQYSE